MATGPEHYREAERLLYLAQGEAWPAAAQLAHVHATLALAAATALSTAGGDQQLPAKDRTAWLDTASECRKKATA